MFWLLLIRAPGGSQIYVKGEPYMTEDDDIRVQIAKGKFKDGWSQERSRSPLPLLFF